MAVYTFSVIESGVVGDSGVTITEDNISNGMGLLLNSLGNTSYAMESLCIWTDNPLQLENYLTIDDVDRNGNTESTAITPYVDSYAMQNICCFNLRGFMLTSNTRLNLKIEGNTNLRLSFKMDTNKFLSSPDLIKDITGIDEIKEIREILGQTEPEEPSGWDKVQPSTGQEPEEEKKLKAKGADQNTLNLQENLNEPLEVVFDALKKEDLYAPTSDPVFMLKQETLEQIAPSTKKQEIKKIINKKKLYKVDSQVAIILVLGAVSTWLIAGAPNILKEITR